MRRFLFFAVVCGLWLAPELSAQQRLPERFGGWSASQAPVQAAPDVASKQPAEAAAVLSEAGMVQVIRRGYANGAHALTLTLYQMRDSSAALAAFGYLRAPEMVPSDLGLAAAVSRDRAVILSGSAVVEVTGLAEAAVSDLRELAAVLSRSADKTPPPPVPTFLPAAHRIAGSERYILGPVALRAAAAEFSRPALAAIADKVGFDAGAEAVLARYRDTRGEAALLLLEYPTPQLAGLHLKHIEAALGTLASSSATPIRRTGSLLSFVLPGASPAAATALLDGVRYETGVTWNEPSHTATDPPWSALVVNTIVGTGVFLAAAFAFGIAFGGVRIVTKLLFPGRVFDRRAQMQILQLGIASKPIDADDFYASWSPRAWSGR